MIERPHKSQVNSGNNMRSGEEQRRLLCGNKVGNRCSSLDFNASKKEEDGIASTTLDRLTQDQLLKLEEYEERMAEILFNTWLSEINRDKKI